MAALWPAQPVMSTSTPIGSIASWRKITNNPAKKKTCSTWPLIFVILRVSAVRSKSPTRSMASSLPCPAQKRSGNMIRHIVMFNAKNPADKDAIYNGLKTLEAIKGDWTLRVSRNLKADQIDNDIDFVVYGEFPNEAALQSYKDDPIYTEAIRLVRPLRDLRIAADIEAE